MFNTENTKYEIHFTSLFKKQYKKSIKQGKDANKLAIVLEMLANGRTLNQKYKDHLLVDNKYYKDCRECHISPDWLLIYKYNNDKLLLLLIEIGTHSDLFGK